MCGEATNVTGVKGVWGTNLVDARSLEGERLGWSRKGDLGVAALCTAREQGLLQTVSLTCTSVRSPSTVSACQFTHPKHLKYNFNVKISFLIPHVFDLEESMKIYSFLIRRF